MIFQIVSWQLQDRKKGAQGREPGQYRPVDVMSTWNKPVQSYPSTKDNFEDEYSNVHLSQATKVLRLLCICFASKSSIDSAQSMQKFWVFACMLCILAKVADFHVIVNITYWGPRSVTFLSYIAIWVDWSQILAMEADFEGFEFLVSGLLIRVKYLSCLDCAMTSTFVLVSNIHYWINCRMWIYSQVQFENGFCSFRLYFNIFE